MRGALFFFLLVVATACARPSGDDRDSTSDDHGPSRFVPPNWNPAPPEEAEARRVCERFALLDTKDGGATSDLDMKKCVKELAELRKSDKPTYDCLVECTKLKDYDGAMGCVFACMLKSKSVKKP